MSKDTTSRPLRNVIEVDEGKIQDHLGAMVRGTVEENLNSLLDAEAERVCNAGRYERTEERQDVRSGHYPVEASSA